MATTTGKSFLTGGGNALRGARNGSRLFMKQKYSLNVQIIPGERENFDVSEKRFDREVQSANIMRELRRRREFECTQTQKKRKIEEKKMRRRASFRGGRRFSRDPVSWENYFGGDVSNLFGIQEDLEFKFLQSETTIPCNAFDHLFSE